MTWTPITTIAPISNWLFTEPVEGSFFRLKHSSFPRDGSYEIAQAEIDTDGAIHLFDVQQLKPSLEAQTIEFKKPGIFDSRRIALRRVAKQPTFEKELRRIIRENVLRDPEDPLFPPHRVNWRISIEASDYIEPQPTQGTGGSTTTVTNLHAFLPYRSDGDANGIFYFLGTQRGTTAWANPHTSGQIILSPSGVAGWASPTSFVNLVDRNAAVTGTDNQQNSFYKVDLGSNKILVCNQSIIQAGDAVFPRGWKLEGSINDTDWITLGNKSETMTFYSWSSMLISNNSGFRFFRIVNTALNSYGDYSFVLSEWELYGTLKINNI